MKKKIAGFLVAGIAVFALSGCGGGDDTYIIDESPIPETFFITDDFGDGVGGIIYHCDSGLSGVTNFEGAFTFDLRYDNCNFDMETNNIQQLLYLEYGNDPFVDEGIDGIEYECVTYGDITEYGFTGPSGFITDGGQHQGCTLFDIH